MEIHVSTLRGLVNTILCQTLLAFKTKPVCDDDVDPDPAQYQCNEDVDEENSTNLCMFIYQSYELFGIHKTLLQLPLTFRHLNSN